MTLMTAPRFGSVTTAGPRWTEVLTMRVPNYIRTKMHLCASHAAQAAKYDAEISIWLDQHDIDVESISTGDGYSFEELLYGNDVTDELCKRIEKMNGGAE